MGAIAMGETSLKGEQK